MSRLWVLGLLLAACDGPIPETPLTRDCRLHIHLEEVGAGAEISSESNDLDGQPLEWTGTAWTGAFSLPPGRHLYRLVVDGQPFLDPQNPVSIREGGVEWSVFDAADCRQPAWRLTRIAHGEGAPDVALTLERVGAGLDPGSVTATVEGRSVPVEVEGDTVRPDLRPAGGAGPGKRWLELTARDTEGREVEPLRAPFWNESERFRWEDAVVYQVALDRFAREDPFTPADRLRPPGDRLGGNLSGLQKVLESGYFEALGINTLWLSPLNLNPEGLWTGVEGGAPRYSSYHGYWPIAPRAVDPKLGSEAEVEALVAAAHARGMRVIVDVVLNHVHEQHPYLVAHPEWFGATPCACGTAVCPWHSHIQTCWFTPYLPDFNWDFAEGTQQQIDDAVWWLERFDLDGLRVDAVPMMPRFVTRGLTRAVHQRLEGLRTRVYLVGETFTGPGGYGDIRWSLGPMGLDGQFDFPLMWSLRQVFAWESLPLWSLADAWDQSRAAWHGSTAIMGIFLGNHDVTRFLSEAAGQVDPGVFEQAWRAPPPIPDDPVAHARLRLAWAYVLTVPGAPVIYQGDEYGQPGVGDPDNRRPMRFGGERTALEQATAAQVARLGRLRRCLPALRRGELRPLVADAEHLAFARTLGDGAPALVVLQRAGTGVDLRLPPGLDAADGMWREVLSDQEVWVRGGRLVLPLPARSAAVLVPSGHACSMGER